jgi:hypothetical protein
MSTYLCHDFKTPRTDTSKRLPDTMRLVPIMFYAVLVLGVASGVRDYLALTKSEQQIADANIRKESLEAQKIQLDGELADINQQKLKGEMIAQWVEGTRTIQPIAVAIARAIPQETDITTLILERNPELPAQVSLTLKMLNGGMPEFTKVETSISKLNYRSHSPQQEKMQGGFQIRSMLVYQAE